MIMPDHYPENMISVIQIPQCVDKQSKHWKKEKIQSISRNCKLTALKAIANKTKTKFTEKSKMFIHWRRTDDWLCCAEISHESSKRKKVKSLKYAICHCMCVWTDCMAGMREHARKCWKWNILWKSAQHVLQKVEHRTKCVCVCVSLANAIANCSWWFLCAFSAVMKTLTVWGSDPLHKNYYFLIRIERQINISTEADVCLNNNYCHRKSATHSNSADISFDLLRSLHALVEIINRFVIDFHWTKTFR